MNKIIRKITGTSKRLPGSGRPRTARTADKIEEGETLVLRQEDLPQTHRIRRQIARNLVSLYFNVPSIVGPIVKKDLGVYV